METTATSPGAQRGERQPRSDSPAKMQNEICGRAGNKSKKREGRRERGRGGTGLRGQKDGGWMRGPRAAPGGREN